MKSLFRVLAVGTCIILLTAPVHAASDPGGFLGLKWSQSPAECKKAGVCSNDALNPEGKLADETVFMGKIAAIDGVKLRFCTYAFNNSKYYLGTAAFEPTKEAYETLKAALTKKHGKPNVTTEAATSWTIGNTRVLLSNDGKLGGLMYANVTLFGEVAKAKKYPPYKPPVKK